MALVSCDCCGEPTTEAYCISCSAAAVDGAHSDSIIELAAAIRRGDKVSAENALDRLAADLSGWRELVDRGRYSRAARAA